MEKLPVITHLVQVQLMASDEEAKKKDATRIRKKTLAMKIKRTAMTIEKKVVPNRRITSKL